MKKCSIAFLVLALSSLCSCAFFHNFNSGNTATAADTSELKKLFQNEKELMKSIASQLWEGDDNIAGASLVLGTAQFGDGQGNAITVPKKLQEETDEYFDNVGEKQRPTIVVYNFYGKYKVVYFNFCLPKGVQAGILFSPKYNENWPQLEKDWYIYVEEFV